jgi:hypothetical protein
MKLSITQIILGALIVFAACFIVGWMTYQAPDYLRMPKLDGGAIKGYVDVMPEHKTLFDLSRYSSYLLPALGILLIITSLIQAVRPDLRTRKLAAITLAAGVLTGVITYIITVYGFPTSFNVIDPENSNSLRRMFSGQTKEQGLTQSVAGFTSLVSLAVIGCGIAQLAKTRTKPDILSRKEQR